MSARMQKQRQNSGFYSDLRCDRFLRRWTFALVITFASPIYCDEVAIAASTTVNLATMTVSAIAPQRLTVTEYDALVGTFGESDFDRWAVFGSSTLQATSSVPCPVTLTRQGNMGVFHDTAPFDFSDISDAATYAAVRDDNPSYRVKVIPTITWCGGVTAPQGQRFVGCSDVNAPNLEIVATTSQPITLTHEFGHNQGLFDQHCSTCADRIMFGTVSAATVDVTASECRSYER